VNGFIIRCLRRDWAVQQTYRFDTLLRVIGVALQLLLFYFLARLMGARPEALAVSGGDYFPFVLVGLALSPIFSCGISFCTGFIREETAFGTIDAVFALPVSLRTILCGAASGRFLAAFAESTAIVLLGVLAAGIPASPMRLVFLACLLCCSALVYAGIGLIAGSFVLTFKRGDPVQWLVINVSDLLGGVYFPITLLPGWAQALSWCIPTTYIVRLGRQVLLAGDYTGAGAALASIAVAGVCSIAAGLAVFSRALRHVRRTGSLGHF